MTVAELQAALQAAIDRGLPPETAVVVDLIDFTTVVSTSDPTADQGYDLWFTLHVGDVADSRTTPGGMPQ